MRQFLSFLLSGGIAAALNFGSRFLFSKWFPYEFSVVMAFFVGLITGFFLMRYLVFKNGGQPLASQAGRYVFVNIFALGQTLLISILLAKWLLPSIGLIEHAEALAHFVAILVPVFTSYIGHKRWSFR